MLKPELVWLYLYIQTAQEYASDEKRFLMDLGVAWNKLATADRWQKNFLWIYLDLSALNTARKYS